MANRLPVVTMYSRRNCHLCEVAKEVVESARNEAEFEFEVVFIDGDAGLEKEYGEEVPVTLINASAMITLEWIELALSRQYFIRINNAVGITLFS